MRRLYLGFHLICPLVLLGTSSLLAEPARLDRQNLLQYRGADGEVRPVTTPEEWKQRRAEIVRGMESVMGKFPDADRRVDLQLRVETETDVGTYVRQLITYQSDLGSRTPAYLCIPQAVADGAGQAAAVLCLHPTDNTVGHKVVVGLSDKRNRSYAAELAERGYVTLSPAYPHLANYWPNLSALGYASGTMKAIWDNSRGLDLLASLPYVDDSRGFAAVGHSLGGHNAIFTAVFDQRISVLASSCGFDSFSDYFGGNVDRWYFGRGWCQILYMPRLSDYRGRLDQIPFDFPELLAALAPRALFVNAPLGDSNFVWQSVDECAAAARPVFELLGAAEHLIIRHPDSEHDFVEPMRQEAYEMIDAVLRPRE